MGCSSSQQSQSNGDYSIWGYDARGRVRNIWHMLAANDWERRQSLDFLDIRRDALGNITYYRAAASGPQPIEAIVAPGPGEATANTAAGTTAAAPVSVDPTGMSTMSGNETYYGPKSGEVWYGYDPGVSEKPYGLLYSEVSTRSGGYNNAFTYDAAYNPVTFRTGPTLTYNYDNQQIGTGFDHDGNGNPTTYGGTAAQYDVEDRLARYGNTIYGYSADGFRAWRQTGTNARTYFLYVGGLPVLEMDGSGAVTALNTFGAAGLVSRATVSSGVPYHTWYTFDPSGNVASRVVTGTEVVGPNFDAFGKERGTAWAEPFGFAAQAGAFTDTETGLVLMGYRYYDPNAGRFLTRDPIGYAGGLNLYGYVGNNPVNFVDPLGLSPDRSGDGNWLDRVQTGLDIVGLIPGLGEGADGINGLIYLARGDYVNAGLSAGAMIPGIGAAATLGKMANRADSAMDAARALRGVEDSSGLLSSGAARREAMRQAGIPTSQQPVSQLKTNAGYQYVYEHNGRTHVVTQQTTDNVPGHGPHWEAGEAKTPIEGAEGYGRDPLGRVKVQNGKAKVEYHE